MKRILFASLLFASPALAQQPPLQTQIDAGEATVLRVVSGFGNTIAQQAEQIEALRRQAVALSKQVADLTTERDALKAAAKPAPAP